MDYDKLDADVLSAVAGGARRMREILARLYPGEGPDGRRTSAQADQAREIERSLQRHRKAGTLTHVSASGWSVTGS